MLTDDMILENLRMAGGLAVLGKKEAWQGVSSSRPPSKYPVGKVEVKEFRDKVRKHYADQQEGLCVQCGKALDYDLMELCHIVARGPKVLGFVDANLYAGHSGCNSSTKPQYDGEGNLVKGIPVLMTEHLARPDLVVMVKPSWVEVARKYV